LAKQALKVTGLSAGLLAATVSASVKMLSMSVLSIKASWNSTSSG
jgi:hypothetical protein